MSRVDKVNKFWHAFDRISGLCVQVETCGSGLLLVYCCQLDCSKAVSSGCERAPHSPMFSSSATAATEFRREWGLPITTWIPFSGHPHAAYSRSITLKEVKVRAWFQQNSAMDGRYGFTQDAQVCRRYSSQIELKMFHLRSITEE